MALYTNLIRSASLHLRATLGRLAARYRATVASPGVFRNDWLAYPGSLFNATARQDGGDHVTAEFGRFLDLVEPEVIQSVADDADRVESRFEKSPFPRPTLLHPTSGECRIRPQLSSSSVILDFGRHWQRLSSTRYYASSSAPISTPRWRRPNDDVGANAVFKMESALSELALKFDLVRVFLMSFDALLVLHRLMGIASVECGCWTGCLKSTGQHPRDTEADKPGSENAFCNGRIHCDGAGSGSSGLGRPIKERACYRNGQPANGNGGNRKSKSKQDGCDAVEIERRSTTAWCCCCGRRRPVNSRTVRTRRKRRPDSRRAQQQQQQQKSGVKEDADNTGIQHLRL